MTEMYLKTCANTLAEKWNEFFRHRKSTNRIKKRITSFSIDWYNCGCCHVDSIVHESTTLYLNKSEIKIKSYNGHKKIVRKQTIHVGKDEIKGLFDYIQYEALNKLQQNYRVEICDGSEWILKLIYSDGTITAIQGNVEIPPCCEDIEKKIKEIIFKAKSFADPILFGC